MRGRVHLGALLIVGVAGCQEPPSFRARWNLIDRQGNTQPATAPLQCTSLGINTVRIRVIDELGLVVDDSYHACFARNFDDPEASVAGPTLDAGRYAVEVRGVQRDLELWPVTIPEDDPPLTRCDLDEVACDSREVACDCAEFEARDDHTERLADFVISAPDECIDGIDNDRDGLLDASDPSCALDSLPRLEGKPVSKVQFRIGVSLFDGTDVVTCGSVGLTTIGARLCARAAGEPAAACDEADMLAALACREGQPIYFEQTLPEGEYTLELVGLGVGGVARTIGALFPITVSPGAGALVPVDVDFAAADFDPPIEDYAGFTLGFADDAAPGGQRGCDQLGDSVTDVVLEVRDAHGAVLATPVSLADGTVLDGTPIACPNKPVLTESLVWGGYSLRVAARAADGTVCFTTDGTGPGGADAPLRLAPAILPLVVPRVLDAAGEPPPGCAG